RAAASARGPAGRHTARLPRHLAVAAGAVPGPAASAEVAAHTRVLRRDALVGGRAPGMPRTAAPLGRVAGRTRLRSRRARAADATPRVGVAGAASARPRGRSPPRTPPCRNTCIRPGDAAMKLLAKFNLIFVLVMAVGVAVSGWISHGLLAAGAGAPRGHRHRPPDDGEGARGALPHHQPHRQAAADADAVRVPAAAACPASRPSRCWPRCRRATRSSAARKRR
ncbi:MAG: hypothetical protein RL227_1125, partial [Pseudomonadota bacterium]